jgi:hypothetical protein
MAATFSAVAIIAAFNEADVIGQVISDFIDQGIGVYVIDDGSTDDTAIVVEPFIGHGVINYERRVQSGAEGATGQFDWTALLERKAELARVLDADWLIHNDADEFRESPWPHIGLLEAIRRVDALGFNAIDSMRFDFWPTHDGLRPGDDPRPAFTAFAPAAEFDRVQIRCWKKTSAVDLASSGGHEARFPGRKVFPVRFILRHYPVRSQAHGERKVFRERQVRFTSEERRRGWHVQYDGWRPGMTFIRDPATLIPYDGDAVRLDLMLHHRHYEDVVSQLEAARIENAALEGDLGSRDSVIEQNVQEVRQTRAALTVAQQQIRGLETEVAVHAAELIGVRIELATARAALTVAHQQVSQLQTNVEANAADLEVRTIELAASRTAAEVSRIEMEELRGEVDRRARVVRDLTVDRGRDAWEIDRLHRLGSEAERRIDELLRSRSWRWMAPARAILGVAVRLRLYLNQRFSSHP